LIALLFAGSAALTASAQTSRGAGDINSAAQNFMPIERAACRGWGPIAGRDSPEFAANHDVPFRRIVT
jgi:predicted small secreted protein